MSYREVSIHEATHVKHKGRIMKIAGTWGIDGNKLAKPSEGGFGVITESGEKISMWEAEKYLALSKPLPDVTVQMSPLMIAALRNILVEYALENKGDPFGKPLQWVDVTTDQTVTLDDLLTFISNL